MPRIPDDDLAGLKRNTDLAALVRAHGVELKKHGSRDLAGRCPFHEEKTASFIVTPAKNLFHCLGCGAAGGPIDFVMQAEGLSVPRGRGPAPRPRPRGAPLSRG